MPTARTHLVRVAYVASLLAVIVFLYGWWDAYTEADKACTAFQQSASEVEARASMKAFAESGADVFDARDIVFVVYRRWGYDLLACSAWLRGGEVLPGKRGTRLGVGMV